MRTRPSLLRFLRRPAPSAFVAVLLCVQILRAFYLASNEDSECRCCEYEGTPADQCLVVLLQTGCVDCGAAAPVFVPHVELAAETRCLPAIDHAVPGWFSTFSVWEHAPPRRS